MGLDMFMFKYRLAADSDAHKELDQYDRPPNSKLLGTWRKHNRLHGAMQELWYKKPYEAVSSDRLFSYLRIYLTLEDLDSIEADIRNRRLPYCSGFFFGEDSYRWDEDEQKEQNDYTLGVLAEARKALREGYLVYYDSGW